MFLMVVNIVVVDLIIVVILFCDVTRSVIILDEVVSMIFAMVLSIKSAVLVVITTAVIMALDRIIISICRVVVVAVMAVSDGITTVLSLMVFTVTTIAGDVNGVVDTSVGQEISITNIA